MAGDRYAIDARAAHCSPVGLVVLAAACAPLRKSTTHDPRLTGHATRVARAVGPRGEVCRAAVTVDDGVS